MVWLVPETRKWTHLIAEKLKKNNKKNPPDYGIVKPFYGAWSPSKS